MKAQLTIDIFLLELLHVFEQKSVSRDELVKETRKVMLELSRQMRETVCEHTQAEQMIWKLSEQLGEVKGKKSYGYLPRPMKRQVDEIVDQLERIPVVNECYQKWWDLQCQVNAFYSGKQQPRPPLSQLFPPRIPRTARPRYCRRYRCRRHRRLQLHSRRLQVHGPVGLVSLADLLRFLLLSYICLLSHFGQLPKKCTNLLDGDVKVCYGDVRKPIRKGCIRLRRYVPNPSSL